MRADNNIAVVVSSTHKLQGVWPTGTYSYKKNNSDAPLEALQQVKWLLADCFGSSNDINRAIMSDRTEIRGHSLCQHPVESVLYAWQERGLATETATSIIQTGCRTQWRQHRAEKYNKRLHEDYAKMNDKSKHEVILKQANKKIRKWNLFHIMQLICWRL